MLSFIFCSLYNYTVTCIQSSLHQKHAPILKCPGVIFLFIGSEGLTLLFDYHVQLIFVETILAHLMRCLLFVKNIGSCHHQYE